MDEFKTFLKEYNNELQQSPTSENVHPKIVGNYCLDREDVPSQVIDWVLHYLENRKCPYDLAVAIAKNIAKQIDSDISEQLLENNVDQEKLLNSYSLYTQTLKKLPSVCNTFLEQIDEETCSPSCSLPYATSVFDIKNKRRTMEDRHVIHHNLNLLLDLKDAPTHSYYAVFDGHSGIDAASYASAHLHVNIAKHPEFLTDTSTAIAQSYKTTDENFLKTCSEQNLKSGTTAVSALIKENKLYLSWVGDSQAVLVKGGKPVFVTEPHKPQRPDEKQRIEELGGAVTYMGVWRVNGMLAITRALGDFDHRPFIISEPEMATIDLDGTEDFLILACDGLWDEMSPEEATAALYHNLSENAVEEPLDAIAAKLVHKSKEQGSEDNITTVVVFLRDMKIIKDYAIELLSHASLQNHFLGMNGDGNHSIETSPCVKPTVLELNSASTKKLKNTANVLSSTGVSYPVFSESGLDAFQGTNDSSVFVPRFAPEATALSELPTPPIDDVVASHQIGNLCSAELYEGLNSISTEQSSLVEDETNVFNSGVFDSMVNVQPFCPENQIPIELNNQNSVVNDFTPDEAADVASCVVSNTIETAVKCLSSNDLLEPVIPVSTIKLNPYAKPFIPGETQLQIESEVTTNSDSISVSQCDLEEANVAEVSKISLVDCIEGNVENIATEPIKEAIGSALNSKNLEPVQKNEKESLDLFFTSKSADRTPNSQVTSGTEVDNKSMEQDYLLEAINDSEIVGNQASVLHNMDDSSKEPEHLSQVLQKPILPNELDFQSVENLDIGSVGLKEEIKSAEENVDVINVVEDVSNIEKRDMDIHGDGIPQTIMAIEADLIVHDDHIKPNEKNCTLNQEIASPIPINHSVELMGECLISKEISPFDKLESGDCIGKIVLEPESPIDNISKYSGSPENCDASSVSCVITPDSEKMHDKIQNTKLLCENLEGSVLEEKCASPIKVSDMGIALETIAFGSLNIVNVSEELTSAEAVPSDSADEGPVDAVAVDLQTIPVGVPEAEGVTEDVDSDSEKDGGWSYMKGNVIGGKSKAGEPQKSNVEKQAGKSDTISKLKKDAPKAISDKAKVRSLTSTDKTKKPLLEKKTIEVKDKTRPTKTVPSSLPRDSSKATLTKSNIEKPSKPISTLARAKKEITATASTSKVSTTSTLKPSRPTTLRNPAAGTKPVAPLNTERSGAVKTTSSATVGNIRPKSALSTNAVKAPSRPTVLPKTQPSNPNKAPSARSTTLSRPLVSTVPTRALNKPSSLSKPSGTESKVKPPVSTLKKAELKKPDVKETKDIVNKQISARKNVAIRSETIKSATTSNKSAMTLSNKPVPSKTRSAPVKTDANKKDVPKSGMSRLATKTNAPIKMSPNAAKSNDKTALVQDKVKQPNELATADEPTSTKVTPPSEEEKCILEVHDKEVMSIEEKDEIIDQKHICLENGISESIKPLEEIVASTNEVKCSAQIL